MNVQELQEVVINVVDYAMVQQMSLASTEYAEGVNEFVKAGFTPIPSMLVKPFRVQEAPVQFECKVNQVIALGNQGGAGNLVICEVVKIHISEAVLDEKGAIVQEKLDLVARLGGNWYSRANAGLFEVPKPLTTLGIGVDAIPDFVKKSGLFSGNDLGVLANIDALPSPEEVAIFVKQNFELKAVLSADEPIKQLQLALRYVQTNDVESAWKVLLA
jgi:hypothetical protein